MKGKGKEMESEEKGGDWRGKVVDWKKKEVEGGHKGKEISERVEGMGLGDGERV